MKRDVGGGLGGELRMGDGGGGGCMGREEGGHSLHL